MTSCANTDCTRPTGHDGPHRNPVRGEWANPSPTAKTCGDKYRANGIYGRCSRDPGHNGGHADYTDGSYWQAAS